MNIYYVYIYCNPLKPGDYTYYDLHFPSAPFYIGKGKYDRFLDHLGTYPLNHEISHKANTINKILLETLNIPDIFIPFTDLTESEAFNIEIALISHFGRRNNNTGILTNLTDGGEGTSGRVVSDYTRRLASGITTNHMRDPKNRKRISDTLKGRPVSAEHAHRLRTMNIGKKHSEETKNKISESNKGKHIPKKMRKQIAKSKSKDYLIIKSSGEEFIWEWGLVKLCKSLNFKSYRVFDSFVDRGVIQDATSHNASDDRRAIVGWEIKTINEDYKK